MAQTPTTARGPSLSNPAFQAYAILRMGFALAPILFGLDKFVGLLEDDWTEYLWPSVPDALPLTPEQVMLAVGVIEILAGIVVAFAPRIGGLVVAAWLAVIIVNLLLLGEHYDIALRDFGLLLGAVSLSRLAQAFSARAPSVGASDR